MILKLEEDCTAREVDGEKPIGKEILELGRDFGF